jgi:hypothetical protein
MTIVSLGRSWAGFACPAYHILGPHDRPSKPVHDDPSKAVVPTPDERLKGLEWATPKAPDICRFLRFPDNIFSFRPMNGAS